MRKAMSATEFKFLNQNAEKITLSIGVVMIAFGLFVSVTSDSKSLTSFIPSCLGLVLFILGFYLYGLLERSHFYAPSSNSWT